jgi:hypothetical protein
MAWTDAQQKLARALYAATRKEARYAPMDYPVSVGNVLMRAFPRKYMPLVQGRGVPASAVNAAALTVRDALTDSNRFSGIIPAGTGAPAIVTQRGALYCAKDTRAQMAEVLHYAPGSQTRAPGSLPFPLQTLHQKCMVLLKPTRDINLVTLDGTGAHVQAFFDRLQRVPEVRAALSALRYADITQAIFSGSDYSAARGLGLGLMSNPDIDGLEIGSARSFETTGDEPAMSMFRSGANVLVFGRDQDVLSHRLRIVSLHLIEPDRSGHWRALTLRPDAAGDFVVAAETPL